MIVVCVVVKNCLRWIALPPPPTRQQSDNYCSSESLRRITIHILHYTMSISLD